MKKEKSIVRSKIIQTVIAAVTIIAGGVVAISAIPKMDVDGVACGTFADCRALADPGSTWTFSGDWSGSGKLSVPNSNITLKGVGAVIQYASVTGDKVEMYGFEITKSPVGINGLYWEGDFGYIHDINCHDSGLTCIRLYKANNTTVENSNGSDNRRGVPGNSDGMNCSNGANNTFIGNTAANNGDDGFDVWNCKNSIIKNNYAPDNCGGGDQNGFKLGPGGGALVEGNTASRNCSAGFASNEGGNTYINNVADHNLIGFSDWRGPTGGIQYSVYSGNIAYENGTNFKISAPSQYVTFDKSNTTATPVTTQAATVTATYTATPRPTVAPTLSPLIVSINKTPIPCARPCVIEIK